MHQAADRPVVDGPVHCALLDRDRAEGFEPLAAFCCGHCALDPSAREVNLTAAKLYLGGPPEAGGEPALRSVILLLDQHDSLLGIAGMTTQDPGLGEVGFIQTYGREKRLKGHVLADQTTTLGDALLRACIELATQVLPAQGAPDTYALTHWDNTSSHHALTRLGFVSDPWDGVVEVPNVGWHHRYTLPSGKQFLHQQQLWHRPSGPPLSPLPPEVYVGPVP